MAEKTPIRPTDDEARALARGLIDGARFAALGVIEPATAAPMVTRIGLTTAPDGVPLTLVSDLSHHTRALRTNPVCSLLLGEPGAKGDPLIHPRLTLQARADFVDRSDPAHSGLRAHYQRRLRQGLRADARRPRAALDRPVHPGRDVDPPRQGLRPCEPHPVAGRTVQRRDEGRGEDGLAGRVPQRPLYHQRRHLP